MPNFSTKSWCHRLSGADDFVGSAVTALNMTDTGLIVVNAQYGVEVGTQNIFRTATGLNKPVIFAINQLDGEKADYDNVMEQMREHFGSNIVAIQYPIACGEGFNAMIDVLLMKKYSWGPEGGVPKIEEIPAEEMERAKELHAATVELSRRKTTRPDGEILRAGPSFEDDARRYPQRSCRPLHIPGVLRQRAQGYGRAPHDGVPRQRRSLR